MLITCAYLHELATQSQPIRLWRLFAGPLESDVYLDIASRLERFFSGLDFFPSASLIFFFVIHLFPFSDSCFVLFFVKDSFTFCRTKIGFGQVFVNKVGRAPKRFPAEMEALEIIVLIVDAS